MKQIIALSLALMLGLSACSSVRNMSTSEQIGTGVGVVAGTLLGFQVGQGWGRALATVTGAVVGGTAGYYTGNAIDDTK